MMDLQELGFTQEELQKRVIERLCEELMHHTVSEDGEGSYEWIEGSGFRKALDAKIKDGIDGAIDLLAEEHVLPNVAKQVEETCLQETNQWGEARGEPITFVEYLVFRAERYLTEQVDYDGKGKGERGGYSWTGKQSRVTHLVHQHLHYSIQEAMAKALQKANSAIAIGIQETVKLKLAEVVASLKVSATVKT